MEQQKTKRTLKYEFTPAENAASEEAELAAEPVVEGDTEKA